MGVGTLVTVMEGDGVGGGGGGTSNVGVRVGDSVVAATTMLGSAVGGVVGAAVVATTLGLGAAVGMTGTVGATVGSGPASS